MFGDGQEQECSEGERDDDKIVKEDGGDGKEVCFVGEQGVYDDEDEREVLTHSDCEGMVTQNNIPQKRSRGRPPKNKELNK